MATVNDRAIVDNIIEHNGRYFEGGEDTGDPTVIKIVQYNNQFDGGLAYGLVYDADPPSQYNRYETAPACHNPVVLFEKGK